MVYLHNKKKLLSKSFKDDIEKVEAAYLESISH